MSSGDSASLSALGSLPSLPTLPTGGSLPVLPGTTSTEDSLVVPSLHTVQPPSFVAEAAEPSVVSDSSTVQDTVPAAVLARLQRLQGQRTAVTHGANTLAVRKTVAKPYRKSRANQQAPVATDAADRTALGAWTPDEVAQLRQLVEQHGVGSWDEKAQAMGTGRTAKALHTRWLRESGRIIDMPRGQQNLLNEEMTSVDVRHQEEILEQAGELLPMLSGSLAAAFGTVASTASTLQHEDDT